jgi:hypothetical protein
MTTPEMEIALASFFGYRRNIVVPNISWGLDLHECDLLVLTKAGYAWEVEIKTTKSDLIADKSKRHKHQSRKIAKLFFAIPEKLNPFIEHIPDRAGIIIVRDWMKPGGPYRPACELIRAPQRNGKYKFTPTERLKLAELATLRIWGLKQTIERFKTERRLYLVKGGKG